MNLRKVCPQGGAAYGAESRFCSVDGATLVLEQPADDLVGTIVADRYHVVSMRLYRDTVLVTPIESARIA